MASSRDHAVSYVLMDDIPHQLEGGRCMTMPSLQNGSEKTATTEQHQFQTRTATFTASTTTSTAESNGECPSVAAQSPAESITATSRPATRKGILRSTSSLRATENGGENGASQKRRAKKQVHINTTPGSYRPNHRRNDALSVNYDHLEEIEVEVEINHSEENQTTDGSESAEEVVNGRHLESEDDSGIVYRERQGSRPWSIRNSFTSSLGRIGSRIKRRKPAKLQRLQSALDLDKLAQNELELKANLYWHIGTPIKRWKIEKQVPMKLVLQLLKTLCLIVQVILFTSTIAHTRGEFFFDSRIVFESVFNMNFDPEAALEQHTLYSIQEISQELEFIATNYYRIPEVVIGGYDLARDEDGEPVPLQLYLKQFREATLNASYNRFTLDGNIDRISFNFSRQLHDNITERLFEISDDRQFHKFLELRVSLTVNVIRIEAPEQAQCFRFNVEIAFQNDDNNGKTLFRIQAKPQRVDDCRGEIIKDKTGYRVIQGSLVSLDIIVLTLSILSLFLTAKTLRRAYLLGRAMGQFYHHQLKLPLTWWERRSLFSTWHYVNILSDLFIITGTVIRIVLELNVLVNAAPARILLGTAVLFQAAVILRYLNYFRQVNILTRTLALAFPQLVKFILCGAVLFLAFALCGWIVLGPFHPKFTTFNATVETLFSLLNGDDIYNTFILLDPEVDLAAYIYSRLFLYVFLALFVYGVLNLFTSLVISAYEISQNRNTAIGNEVRRFVFSGPLTPRGVALRDVTSTSKYVDPSIILNKDKRKHSSSDEDE